MNPNTTHGIITFEKQGVSEKMDISMTYLKFVATALKKSSCIYSISERTTHLPVICEVVNVLVECQFGHLYSFAACPLRNISIRLSILECFIL